VLQLLGGDAVNAGRGVALGACLAIAIACGGVRKAGAPAPTATSAAGGDVRAQIEALDRQIAEDMTRAQLPPAPATCAGAACAEAMSQPFATPTRDDPQCRPASSTRCTDTCTLATSICNNQQKICELAGQLEGDDWAAGKCESARASCKAAHDQCCRCAA
jgi:hypothetical protein